ncbi:MAG: hypothetical protein RML36_06240 [Anaerolineae bacterium]|nr:hypothetical protein [Anaerolineae bacterium]MDW8099068.1 hypothetical protein [Anaerolineae bacterium]
MTFSTVLDDLERLKQLYTMGFHDAFLENALRKMIERQIARDEADLQRINEVLVQFEQRFGLTSDEFWQKFQAGQLADTADFIEWNAFCKMRQRLLSRLHILRDNGDHE